MFHSDVVVCNAQDDQAVLGLARLLGQTSHGDLASILILHVQVLAGRLESSLGDLGDELILDEDEGLHGVLEGELVLAHLRQDGANVQVDVARVRDLQTVVNCMLTEV